MKCLMIINPVSGRQTMLSEIQKLAGELVTKNIVQEYEVYYTKGNRDAYEFLQTKKYHEYDFILSAGGDGTQGEVISGVIDSGIDIPVLMVPGGTTNDLATSLKLPSKAYQMTEIIKDFNVEPVDVGKAGDTYFMNVLAGGMFADISYKVDKKQKQKLGPLAYYINGFLELPQQLQTKMDLHIEIDDEVYDLGAYLFIISNSQSIGGFKLATKASVQDGMFDFLAIKQCSITDLAALGKDILLNKHDKSPFLFYKQGKDIRISASKEVIFDLDGEKGDYLPVEVQCLKGAAKMILPKD